MGWFSCWSRCSACWLAAAGALVVAMTLAGCGGDGGPAPGGARAGDRAGDDLAGDVPITNTDACAMRLHDFSGLLLLFYSRYGRLPSELAELADLDGLMPIPPAECPATGQPYQYTADGILLPERNSRVVLYDAAPAHSQRRWAITVEAPRIADGEPVTKVLALPESFFLLRPPQPRQSP